MKKEERNRRKKYETVLRSMGLPPNLLDLIRTGTLEASVARAYERWELVNRLMDELEESDPVLARSIPWSEQRQKWKDAGRPRPEWWEVLSLDVPPYRYNSMAQGAKKPRTSWLCSFELNRFMQPYQAENKKKDYYGKKAKGWRWTTINGRSRFVPPEESEK